MFFEVASNVECPHVMAISTILCYSRKFEFIMNEEEWRKMKTLGLNKLIHKLSNVKLNFLDIFQFKKKQLSSLLSHHLVATSLRFSIFFLSSASFLRCNKSIAFYELKSF